MPITVNGPNGITINFPDGTDAGTIHGAMNQATGQADPSSMPAPAAPPDSYHVAAQQEYDALKAKGVPVEPGMARRVAQGMTLGGADEIMAAVNTPIEMAKAGTLDPVEGYKRAKAWEDVRLAEARKNQGLTGHLAELGGGIFTGGGLAKQGVSLVPKGAGLMGRIAGYTGEGAAYGGTAGFLDSGNSLDERLSGAGTGAAIGGAVGAALPAATGILGTVGAPIMSNIRARINPQGAAVSQLLRGVDESGRPIGDIVGDVVKAAQEGHPQFTIADALGNPGQRLLSSVTRAPGEGRTAAVDFLENRQAGQARRVANTLAEGFDSPKTAAQTEAELISARKTASDAAYGAARQGAGPVDLSGAIANIDATIQPGVNQIAKPASDIANSSIETALQGFKSRLTDGKSTLTDYTAVERVRGDLADAVHSAVKAGNGNRARLLGGVLREVDTAMENASPGFKAANAQHAANSKVIEAVDAGRTAAMRGRVEDTVPAYQGMPATHQPAFRAGYVDPLISQTQGAAFGANKARPLTNDAFQTEAGVMAPGNSLMQRRLGRENTMFDTRYNAMGGSKTADNLADEGALKIDPSMVMALLSGDVHGVVRQGLGKVTNVLNGSTPQVRTELAKLLLQRGASPTLQNDISGQMAAFQRNRAIAQALSRGAVTGTAITAPGQVARTR